MQIFDVKDHEPSWLPEGNWKLTWADEFDGDSLDESKWCYRMSMMGANWPAWTDQGVHIENGNAVFTLIKNEQGLPVSSQLQTGRNFMDQPVEKTEFGSWKLQWNIGKLHENLFTHGPGYYECRCRLQQKEGWWSAFWIQSPVIGSSLDPKESGVEIDIMESFHPGVLNGHNVFTGGYGLDMQRVKVGGGDIDKTVYHRFGVRWDEDGYTFYVDGKEDGVVRQFQTARPEFILISTEVRGYRKTEDRLPMPEAYDAIGDTFMVDYVRVFDEVK